MARQPLSPTQRQRHAVEVLAGANWSEHAIANVVGTSRTTVRKYFKTELTVGRDRRRAEVVLALHRAALRGSAAAQRLYLNLGAETPPPMAERERVYPIGRRRREYEKALNAGKGTEWEDLLRVRTPDPLPDAAWGTDLDPKVGGEISPPKISQ